MATLEEAMVQWLIENCLNVTTATGSYTEDTVTGTVTAQYQVEIESGISEDLDVVGPALLSGTANHPDLNPDNVYILTLSQMGGGDVEYNFSSTSTISGTELDLLQKVS